MCENIDEKIEQIGNKIGFLKSCVEPECKKCGVEHCTLDPISCYDYYILGNKEKARLRNI